MKSGLGSAGERECQKMAVGVTFNLHRAPVYLGCGYISLLKIDVFSVRYELMFQEKEIKN